MRLVLHRQAECDWHNSQPMVVSPAFDPFIVMANKGVTGVGGQTNQVFKYNDYEQTTGNREIELQQHCKCRLQWLQTSKAPYFPFQLTGKFHAYG